MTNNSFDSCEELNEASDCDYDLSQDRQNLSYLFNPSKERVILFA